MAEEEKTVQAGLRLNHYLSLCGSWSRREADRLIGEGRVFVDGERAQPGLRVQEGSLVLVDGRKAVPVPEADRVIYVLYKPVGYVCTTDRRWGDRLIGDLMPEADRLFPMGRLDKDSEGLLLMTNRGELADQVMRARNRHEKEYVVRVGRKITGQFLEQMEKGVWLEELKVRTRPCRVRQVDGYTFQITLTQGLNRQIRRMCLACGYHVRSLKRLRIMNILLGDLKAGEYRRLTAQETEELETLLKKQQGETRRRKSGAGQGEARSTGKEMRHG